MDALISQAAEQKTDTLSLRVRAMTWECPGVVSLELVAPDGGALPAFTPGAHIDLHLADGVTKQYSLCGDPDDRARWRIAVREISGGAGSSHVHRVLRPGDIVRAAGPRNNFALVPSEKYLFIAGGIGITPLLPMLRAATQAGASWSLHYSVSRSDAAPFAAEARALGGAVSLHVSDSGTRLDVAARLATVEPDTLVYCCGPERLMTAVEAAAHAWPEDSVRFEWFSPRTSDENLSGTRVGFEVLCARSGKTVTVPPDRSVLESLRAVGIAIPFSCEQGICGTCECSIVEGAVEHRDSILSAKERAANATMMVCVSRAAGTRLVLDV